MEENEHLRSNKESTGRKQVYKREMRMLGIEKTQLLML